MRSFLTAIAIISATLTLACAKHPEKVVIDPGQPGLQPFTLTADGHRAYEVLREAGTFTMSEDGGRGVSIHPQVAAFRRVAAENNSVRAFYELCVRGTTPESQLYGLAGLWVYDRGRFYGESSRRLRDTTPVTLLYGDATMTVPFANVLRAGSIEPAPDNGETRDLFDGDIPKLLLGIKYRRNPGPSTTTPAAPSQGTPAVP